MYEEELKELGLTKNEAKIYSTLLEYGILNPTKLAEKTGLHRSYIYDTLERLLEKGIVNTILIAKKKNYQAVDPKILKESYELKLKKINDILPQLYGLFQANSNETNVELHKGKHVYRTMIKDLISNLKKDTTIYLLGVNEEILETVEPIYLKQYLNIIKDKKVIEKIIISKGNKKLKEKYLEYKELDNKYIGDTTTIIYQDKVFLFILGHPYYLITIKNKSVANTYLKQFELLWKFAK
ncbi:TrmB family transcriptional regulator [archaeon]|mgnify:CR=1 FL=1|jgi:HTH-type transcriptional regulator, sugar sensing transcriptional regulator|nr:TrmB family transcriptional regulator [archaeon]MBT3451542.1 TrmB family transcriptional regulator [archaeon]MBT6869401.1 TrmB family transcriptional regulator [archaeon]MBT7192564.1 TrmB family transcriptional regulator [archaeon]MBT7380640.1 TrmB family transcriptional regulator [archaeon]